MKPGPILRRSIFVLAALATLLALFYAVENWRGKRAWRAYERELKEQGVVLDFRAVVPPRIPAESNFAATPFLADLFKGKPSPTNSDARWPALYEMAGKNVSSHGTGERQLTDLPAWQRAFRTVAKLPVATNATRAEAAQEILANLKVYEPVLTELRAASSRPSSSYLVQYDLENPWGIFLPHLSVIKRTCQVLALKTSAELEIGESDAAFQDWLLHMRLAESLHSEAFLISHLVRMAAFHLAMQPLWEGILLQRWSGPQLAQIQKRLAGINFVADVRKCLDTERSAGVQFVEILKKQRNKSKWLNAITGGTGDGGPSVVGLAPIGWWELERRNYVEMFQEYCLPSLDASNRVIHASVAKSNQRAFEKNVAHGFKAVMRHSVLAKLLMPALENVQGKTAFAQAVAHQAVIACALERFRAAKGTYPGELQALTPEFLAHVPLDPVNGGTMRYKSTEPLGIYSIAWDEKDDAGIVATSKWDGQGDWVWTNHP